MEIKVLETRLVALYIKTIRLTRNLKLKDIADSLYISESLLSKIESGERTISPDVFNNILKLYNVVSTNFDCEVYETIDLFIEYLIKQEKHKINKILNLDINYKSFPYMLMARFIQLFSNDKNSTELYNITNILMKTIELYEIKYQQLFYILRGYLLILKHNFNDAKKSIEKGLNINVDESLTALGNYYISFIKRDIKEFKEAINYSEKAIAYFEKTNNLIRLSKGYGHIGSLYMNIGIYTRAIDFYLKSSKYNISNNMDVLVGVNFNIGLCNLELEQYETAINYFMISKELENDTLTCFYIAYCYFKINDKKKAKLYVEEGHSANEFDHFSVCMLNWLEAMLNSKYSKKCEFHLLKLNKKYQDLSLTDKRFLNNRLSEYYEYHEDYKQANYYLKRNN